MNTKLVAFKWCNLYNETVLQHGAVVLSKLEEFKAAKTVNPMKAFGGKDAPFVGNGLLGNHKPRLLHCHMTSDICLVYYLSGANPTVINLLGFFTHDAIGIGRPANIKRQDAFLKRTKSQVLDSPSLKKPS
jgi:hypothetical protein